MGNMEKNMAKKLWQTLEKEHLDLDGAVSQDEWDEFVDKYESEFADECSRQGQILFARFINNTK
jgi:RecA-family ATPase